jgi:acetyl esterase
MQHSATSWSNAAELGIDPGAIVLAGDSAGAQIAAQLAMITTDPTYAARMDMVPQLHPEQLAAVLLLSGAYDLEGIDPQGQHGWFVRTVLWAYSGTRNFTTDERFRLASVTRRPVPPASPARQAPAGR